MNLTDCISNTFSKQCKNNSPIGINKRMDYLVRLEHWIKDNEKKIENWREKKAIERTKKIRPDLLND